MDEATAYTDPENEAVIQAGVARLVQGKTLIVIAHRLSTIADADKIFVVNGGRIVEEGTHGELLAKGKLYAKMWESHISARSISNDVPPLDGTPRSTMSRAGECPNTAFSAL